MMVTLRDHLLYKARPGECSAHRQLHNSVEGPTQGKECCTLQFTTIKLASSCWSFV